MMWVRSLPSTTSATALQLVTRNRSLVTSTTPSQPLPSNSPRSMSILVLLPWDFSIFHPGRVACPAKLTYFYDSNDVSVYFFICPCPPVFSFFNRAENTFKQLPGRDEMTFKGPCLRFVYQHLTV